MKKKLLLFIGLAFFTFTGQTQTVIDIDGNSYNTITIGTQTWLKENLKVTHYENGDDIPIVSNNTTWSGLSTDAYCNYENNANYVTTYGRLYNWVVVIVPNQRHILVLGELEVGGRLLKTVPQMHGLVVFLMML